MARICQPSLGSFGFSTWLAHPPLRLAHPPLRLAHPPWRWWISEFLPFGGIWYVKFPAKNMCWLFSLLLLTWWILKSIYVFQLVVKRYVYFRSNFQHGCQVSAEMAFQQFRTSWGSPPWVETKLHWNILPLVPSTSNVSWMSLVIWITFFL